MWVIKMKFHIVRNNETLDDVLFLYNVTKDELIEENQHIKMWNKIIPGTKLKIPPITEAIEQDISDMEPFIEDYYPKLNYKQKDLVPDQEIPLEVEDKITITSNNHVDNKENQLEKKNDSVKQDIKPGYPPELLKKAISSPIVKKQPTFFNYQYPYNPYGYLPNISYYVIYYPTNHLKRP